MYNNTNNISLNDVKSTKLITSFVILSISSILILYPDIDLATSNLFYNSHQGFYLGKHFIFKFLYDTVPLATKLLSFVCGIGILLNLILNRSFKAFKSPLIYLLFAAILGPGLLVNSFFKNNFGRARPIQIVEFGGTKEYTKPFVITKQCTRNCSFTSGHAAMAFYFTAFAYIVPKYFRIIYALALCFGSVVGVARIAQGGHFLSDVFFSGVFILSLNHFIFKFYKWFTNKIE